MKAQDPPQSASQGDPVPPTLRSGQRVRKLLKLVLFPSIAVICIPAALHYCSPDRELEFVLGVKSLPQSIRAKRIWSNSFQDYVVAAYFEVAPEDLRTLLAARKYEEEIEPKDRLPELSSALDWSQRAERHFPEIKPFKVARIFRWGNERRDTWNTICIDNTGSRVFLTYIFDSNAERRNDLENKDTAESGRRD